MLMSCVVSSAGDGPWGVPTVLLRAQTTYRPRTLITSPSISILSPTLGEKLPSEILFTDYFQLILQSKSLTSLHFLNNFCPDLTKLSFLLNCPLGLRTGR